MRTIPSLLLTVAMFAVPLSAQAESKEPTKAHAAAKHNKRKTASKPQGKGAISVEKLKNEVASKIAHERELVEKASKAGNKGAARKVFDGAVAQVKAKLTSAVNDGLVTKDELKGVRGSYKLMAVKQNSKPASKPAKPAKPAAKDDDSGAP